MLVLSRHRDETIMIGDNIEIIIVDIRGDKVRVGINAPTSVPVHRKEIYDAIQAENQRAADIDCDMLNEIHVKQIQRSARRAIPNALRVDSSNGYLK